MWRWRLGWGCSYAITFRDFVDRDADGHPRNISGSEEVFDADFTDESVDVHRFLRRNPRRNLHAQSVYIRVNLWQKLFAALTTTALARFSL